MEGRGERGRGSKEKGENKTRGPQEEKTVLGRREEKQEQMQPLVWRQNKWEEEKGGNHSLHLSSTLRAGRTENSNTFVRRAEAVNTFLALGRKEKGSKHWHSNWR